MGVSTSYSTSAQVRPQLVHSRVLGDEIVLHKTLPWGIRAGLFTDIKLFLVVAAAEVEGLSLNLCLVKIDTKVIINAANTCEKG